MIKFVIVIFHSKIIVGHVPKNLFKVFCFYYPIVPLDVVTGIWVNTAKGYSLEIPLNYNFFGPTHN